MDNLIGIVNKPQFDTNVFRVGEAFRMTGNSKGYNFDRDCLILKSTPLSLEVAYVDNEYDIATFTIGIAEAVTGRIRLTLKEDKR
ncbi:hypothetical protein B0H39_002186 [Clostridium beijerinckii]|uniref:hypothetical protein n=1 Tax=Clostridium beijerinckii TaxID=1520 RepID=UPI00040A9C21|nr:hypothetical protein [Clostridium beijerinckii]NOW84305.1 hypothetical protein [Clostridium beijerinckii]